VPEALLMDGLEIDISRMGGSLFPVEINLHSFPSGTG